MACPTCDATMERVNFADAVWHCPRCGTIKFDSGVGDFTAVVPALVNRCREFSLLLPKAHYGLCGDWMRLGIAQAIRP